MHKDLNAVKGGDKAMQEMWKEQGKTPPILLANKDNAAVLADRTNLPEPTRAQKRAEEVSKRGGSHAAMLGGLICRNKNDKRGQHETYNSWILKRTGENVAYPEISNTRYGSHVDAAAVLVVFLFLFILFMEFVRDSKDKPGFTNIELNFYNALQNRETLTELCTLALYGIAVSRPFMAHVRKHENILELGTFFKEKADFLGRIIENPRIWTTPGYSHREASLGGVEWGEWETRVLNAVWKYAPDLPDLNDAVVAFVKGARDTFIERFSDEFKVGSDLNSLTKEERAKLFFSSTNDANEGALGSWRIGQRRRPRETLHKFNAAYNVARNQTEAFISEMLNTEEDLAYLRRVARMQDASGFQKAARLAQIEANEKKVAATREKEAAKKERQELKAAAIKETGKNLVLDDSLIDTLGVDDINRQLDFHREEEKRYPGLEAAERVPAKSNMKNQVQRRAELRKAVQRYLSRQEVTSNASASNLEEENAEVNPEESIDLCYESDYYEDMA